MRLLLIRHAESVGNRELRLQGRAEYPLTERGVQQVNDLATALAGAGVSAVYSSPIRRALETAEPIAERLGLTVRVSAALQEYDFGELSGLTWPEIRKTRPELIEQLLSERVEFPEYPGEEGREAFRERVVSALWGIAEEHGGDEAAAVVTHAGPIVVFLMDVLGRGYWRPVPFMLDNAAITTVEIAEAQPFRPRAVLTGLNDTCHLSAEAQAPK